MVGGQHVVYDHLLPAAVLPEPVGEWGKGRRGLRYGRSGGDVMITVDVMRAFLFVIVLVVVLVIFIFL